LKKGTPKVWETYDSDRYYPGKSYGVYYLRAEERIPLSSAQLLVFSAERLR
jgi:hypothetical protein